MTTEQPFEAEYSQGITEPIPSEPWNGSFSLRPGRTTFGEGFAAPDTAFALGGAVITPDAAWDSGYVVINGDRIEEVQRTKPVGVRVFETDGVILPGLLDLHNHPDYNVFAAWEPPQLFQNRCEWRDSPIYEQLVSGPQSKLRQTVRAGTQLRYAEARSLVGGVTAFQGTSQDSKFSSEPLVRNVDQPIFGQHRARSMIDLKGDVPSAKVRGILDDIASGAVDTFYLHLCEGVRGDVKCAEEYQRFLRFNAATAATVIIHGTALDADEIHEAADAGCKLVWSPQSNLRLYGDTTLIEAVESAKMPLALGADWLPTGSTSLLNEMKVARRELARRGLDASADRLVRMVTADAAAIAGLDHRLGSLLPKRPADLLVLERHHADPYESVALAEPSWVEMVLIGGDISYCRTDWFEQLVSGVENPTTEELTAWGKRMTIDTGYQSDPDFPSPSLSTIRRMLTDAYPAVGPIFA